MPYKITFFDINGKKIERIFKRKRDVLSYKNGLMSHELSKKLSNPRIWKVSR